MTLKWRHNGRNSVSNHQPHVCLLNHLFRRRPKKTPKLRVTSLCAGNSPGTGESPAQMASNAENVSIWWRHHDYRRPGMKYTWCNYKTSTTKQSITKTKINKQAISNNSIELQAKPIVASKWRHMTFYDMHAKSYWNFDLQKFDMSWWRHMWRD